MENKNTSKKITLLLILSFFVAAFFPLMFVIASQNPGGLGNELEDFFAITVGLPSYSLYAVPNAVNAIIVCALLRIAKSNKKLLFAPILALVFGAATCLCISKITTAVIFCIALTALFYASVILLDVYGEKSPAVNAAKKVVLIAFSAFNFFVTSAVAVYVIDGGAADDIGLGWVLCIILCYPVYPVFSGIYAGLQSKRFFFLPVIGAAFFCVNALIVTKSLGSVNTEILAIAGIYLLISYACLGITFGIKKAVLHSKEKKQLP